MSPDQSLCTKKQIGLDPVMQGKKDEWGQTGGTNLRSPSVRIFKGINNVATVCLDWSKIQGNNVAWHLDHRNKLACLIQSWR